MKQKIVFSALVAISLFALFGVSPQTSDSRGIPQSVNASPINHPSSGSSVPPATEWNQTYGGYGGDGAYSVVQTSDGGYVIAGNGFANLVKTDPRGVMLWNRTYRVGQENEVRAVVQTSDGGFTIAGWVRFSSTDKNEAWLVKTDADGNAQWNKTYGGPSWDSVFSMRQTKDGGFILAGPTESFGAGGSDFWLVKTDANGVMEWDKAYGGPGNEIAWSVQQASDGGYILAGETWRSPFEAFTIDAWLVKTDPYGNVVWNKTLGRQEGHDRIYCVEKTNDGGYIVAGEHDRRDGYWKSGDFWLVKIDANGNIQWNKQYGDQDPFDGLHEEALSVQQTNDGGFITVGNVYPDRYGSNTDIWLVKTDASGNMQWNNTYGGIYQDGAHDVIQTQDSGYAIAGSSWSVDRGTDFLLIKIMRANPPVASFTYTPENPSTDEEITFNASNSYDLDEDIVSYLWDFGDGNVSSRTDSTIIHAYQTPGTYNVILTVIDSEDLNSSYSEIVWVRTPTYISISTSTASTYVGFQVNVTGTLSDMYGNGLKNETVALYYDTLIENTSTDSLGQYFSTWCPSTRGHFTLKAEWAGNQTHFGSYNITSLDVFNIPTDISISLSGSTSYIGFKVEIDGSLTGFLGGLSETPILLSYSVTAGDTWSDITLTNTTSNGSFSAVWLPVGTGNYLVRASWPGNSTYLGASTTVSMAVIPYEEQNVFSVTSNSTVSVLAFNSTSRELSFTVTGSPGTMGYVSVYIARSLVENIADVKVYLNNEQINYTSTSLDDSWLLHFTYLHSTHKVTISLGDVMAPFTYTPVTITVIFAVLSITVTIFLVTYHGAKRKQTSAKEHLS